MPVVEHHRVAQPVRGGSQERLLALEAGEQALRQHPRVVEVGLQGLTDGRTDGRTDRHKRVQTAARTNDANTVIVELAGGHKRDANNKERRAMVRAMLGTRIRQGTNQHRSRAKASVYCRRNHKHPGVNSPTRGVRTTPGSPFPRESAQSTKPLRQPLPQRRSQTQTKNKK